MRRGALTLEGLGTVAGAPQILNPRQLGGSPCCMQVVGYAKKASAPAPPAAAPAAKEAGSNLLIRA